MPALLTEAPQILQFDLTTKAVLYPRAGIAEYWVLDVLPLAAPEARFRPSDAFGG